MAVICTTAGATSSISPAKLSGVAYAKAGNGAAIGATAIAPARASALTVALNVRRSVRPVATLVGMSFLPVSAQAERWGKRGYHPLSRRLPIVHL
ncbi:MAG: hypothetical protein HWD60_09140 [Defluviicoccus sp.]|nr:MAG: hypothetical protein HWD60_09140 [Defluviicoccus sp.]